MFALPAAELPRVRDSFLDALRTGIPLAYSVLFFSANQKLGWYLLAISLLAPDIGLSGLAGVIAAAGMGWALGFQRASIRNGYLLFNPLLVCMTLSFLHRCYAFPPGTFVAVWAAAVVGSFFLSAALHHGFGQMLGLSAHSLPAVTAAYGLYFLGFALYGAPVMLTDSTPALFDLAFLPSVCQSLLQAFGAMLFQPDALPGALVLIGLAVASPLTALIAVASLSSGAAAMALLGYPLNPGGLTWCSFNFLLTGIALGSGYFIPSRSSLLLALAGAFVCALVAIALTTALRHVELPAGALPYNLVVLAMVYALKQRTTVEGLHPSPAPGALPESAARQVLLNARRFPHLNLPALQLPVKGARTITQAMDDSLTHRGAWQHALDFEAEVKGQRCDGDGSQLTDFYTFDTPVFAPCPGVVTALVSHVPDNPPGGNNPQDNWGNHILLLSDFGYYVMLAHLRQNGVTVQVGQKVAAGELLGHCGNSGRSPVPHLHLQIQSSHLPGGATRPYCLKHYLETDAHGQSFYRTSGIPNKGTVVQSPTLDPSFAAHLSGWLPGHYRYQIQSSTGSSWEETLTLDTDELGRFRLRSDRCPAAHLTAFLTENVFYTTEFEGTDDTLLAWVATGLARVPCLPAGPVRWQDECSIIPFRAPPLRLLQDLITPFVPPALQRYEYRFGHSSDDTPNSRVVLCEKIAPPAKGAQPQHIRTVLHPYQGIAELEARDGRDRTVHARLIDHRAAI